MNYIYQKFPKDISNIIVGYYQELIYNNVKNELLKKIMKCDCNLCFY